MTDPLSLDITATEASMDGFIDNIITITVDDKHCIYCAKIVALLVIHTLLQPLQPSEPLKRYDPLSLSILTWEGQIAHQKTCLGWDIHTHSVGVFLPEEKQTACNTDIKEALASKQIKNIH